MNIVKTALTAKAFAAGAHAKGQQRQRQRRHHRDRQRNSRQSRAAAMREAHEAAAYNQQLVSEIQASVDDPCPNIPHDEVMVEMDADIATLSKKNTHDGPALPY